MLTLQLQTGIRCSYADYRLAVRTLRTYGLNRTFRTRIAKVLYLSLSVEHFARQPFCNGIVSVYLAGLVTELSEDCDNYNE